MAASRASKLATTLGSKCIGPGISRCLKPSRVTWHGKRSHTTVQSRNSPFRVAILGSGPAGFYAASKLIEKSDNTIVDMYEQLPVPFGLVRFGVAPDHPEVKVWTLDFVKRRQD